MSRYQDNGYVNIEWILSCGCPFIVLIGPRGTGKTYTILDYYRRKGELLLYMRRTQSAIDSSSLPELSPYSPIAHDNGIEIMPKKSKDFTYFYNTHRNDDNEVVLDGVVSIGCAFSTFYNKRSLGGNVFGAVFFDEFIKEPLEKNLKGEGKAFLNMCETVNRNRELKGEKPVQFILAGNSDCLNSQILQSIGAIPIIEKMIARGQMEYINQNTGLAVFMLSDSPIATKKKDTLLYRLANNQDFKDMALSNVFTDYRDADDIRAVSPKELVPIIELNKRMVVYRHKGNGNWYIMRHRSGSPPALNLNMAEDRLIWKKTLRNEYMYKRIARELYFDDFDTKVEFQAIIGEN